MTGINLKEVAEDTNIIHTVFVTNFVYWIVQSCYSQQYHTSVPKTASCTSLIKHRGWVLSTPASYLGDPGSNLGSETGYPNWGSLCFS
jgi:hypothetical protein